CWSRRRWPFPSPATQRASAPTACASSARWRAPRTPHCARCTSGSGRTRRPSPASWSRCCVCRRRERGLALLGAVAALAGLSLVAAAVATTAVRDQRRTREALATLQADALVRSGVTTAAALLSDWAALEQPDTLRAPWTVHLPPQALGAGSVTAEVVDE